MIKAVIFDVDGTLVDSNDFHAKAWQEAFAKYGKEITFDAIREQIGKGGDQLRPVFLSEEDNKEFGEELEKYRGELFKEKYLERVKPFPHVRDLFERIKQDGRKIALASSATKDEIEKHQKDLDIVELVNAATSADDAERSKPHPDILQAAFDELGVEPSEAVFVGDSPWDVHAANKAGIAIICLLCGGFAREKLVEAGAKEIFESCEDLLARYRESLLAPVSVPPEAAVR